MEQKIGKRMDALPYPAVRLSPTGKILYRNRFARCLLPPLGRLKEELRGCASLEENFLQRIRLDGIDYLAVAFADCDGERLLCFFENFLPLHEGLSRAILGKMQDFLWDLMNREKTDSEANNLIRLEHFAARACSLRANAEDYLRFLNADEVLKGEEAKSCSLSGFFGYLNRALRVRGLQVDFDFPDETTAFSEGEVLSYLVLNLVYFVRLFCGDRRVSLKVTEEGEGLRFAVCFEDDGKVEGAFETLLCREKEDETSLCILPLLCILRACREKEIPWLAERQGNVFSFSFVLAKGEKTPVLFLSDPAAAEVLALLQMVKTIFS